MQRRFTPKRALASVAAVAMTVLGAGAILRADAQPAPGPTPTTDELVYVSVPPERILDTRNGNGDTRTPPGQKVGAGVPIELDVAGRTLGSGLMIPADAVAVMVNATITEASAPTFVTFHPAGTTRPEASSLNAVFGQNLGGLGSEDVPNMITVQIGTNGNVAIFNFAGATHVLADIAGYFIPADEAHGMAVAAAPTTLDTPDELVTVGTFTAPAAGDWALNGAVNADFVTTNGPTGTVECYWDTGATPVTFGESLTTPARAAFAADAHALDLTAGATVDFVCQTTTATVTINAVLSAEPLEDVPPPTTTTTTTTTTVAP